MIKQESLVLSPYIALYDIIIPKDHELRQLADLVDFSFVDDMLKDMYTLDNGRPGYRPQVMFKYLMLKRMYELSDRDVVKHAMTDMAYKYFLGLAPEDPVIDASSLTKFRKLRMKDESIMDKLVSKSVEIALNNGIKLSKTLIVDSTHSEARYNAKSAREYLLELCKNLRKKVYDVDESYTEKMPKKPDNHQIGLYEDVIQYCQNVINTIKNDDNLVARPNIAENINLLQETIDDTNEELLISKDEDARVGHKTADSSYFGYKTHIAMTPERIITAATVTSGEKPDGKELQSLVDKMEANGIEVENIVGDGAYSERDNIKYANENDIKLVSKLSNMVLSGNRKNKLDSQFFYNKDAKMYVCPNGEMAIKKSNHGKKKIHGEDEPQFITYFFDVNKCKHCPLRNECGFKDNQRVKTYSVKLKMADIHQEHKNKQETQEYMELAKERYKIEAKNAELKNEHGYAHASYAGIHGMTLQAGVSIFVVNLKRVLRLKNGKEGK
jgi:IS5 family transposase